MSLATSDQVQNFFNLFWVRFTIHVVLLTGLILIGQRYWVNFQEKQETERILQANKALATSNSILKLQKDFFESGFYAEKAAKESQWKNLGENVVDTSSLNINNKSSVNDQKYIPETKKTQLSNPEKWFRYIFVGANTSPDNVE